MISLFTLPFWYYKVDKLLKKDGQRGAGSHSLLWFNFILRKALWFLDDGIFSVVTPLPQMYSSKWSRLRVFSCFSPMAEVISFFPSPNCNEYSLLAGRWQFLCPSHSNLRFYPIKKTREKILGQAFHLFHKSSCSPLLYFHQHRGLPRPPTQPLASLIRAWWGLWRRSCTYVQLLLAATTPKYSINSC